MPKNPFRISIIDYLNSAPLNYGFKHGLGYEHFHLKFQVPSVCAEHLKSGDVDAGLISSIEFLRIPGLQIVPGLCIASPKRVRSVVILSKVKPEAIKTLALDQSSRSSVVLGQIILKERYNTQAECVLMPPDLPAMLEKADAALLIGDPAMRARKEGLIVLDLAEEWHSFTGLPFVFALWMVRKNAPLPDCEGGLVDYFHQSLAMGRKNLDAIIDEAWPRIGWTKLELREYLEENIRYTLGPDEEKSLGLFYEKAVSHGFAPDLKPLTFLRR